MLVANETVAPISKIRTGDDDTQTLHVLRHDDS